MALDKKQAAILEKYLSHKRALVIDPSSSSRPAIKKLMTTLGVKVTNIDTVESFSDAEEIISSKKPQIVWCEYSFGNKTALDLLSLHRKIYPNRLETVFIILTESNSPAIASRTADEDSDALLIRPFNFAILEERFAEILKIKTEPSEYYLLLEEGKRFFVEKDFEKALELFRKAAAGEAEIPLANYYIASTLRALNKTDEALKVIVETLKSSPDHYKSLCCLFELKLESKQYDEAFALGSRLFTDFPANPKFLPSLVWLTIYHKKYDEILALYDAFTKIEPFDESLANHIAAALVVCGKFLVTKGGDSRDEALNAFKKADNLMRGKSSILKEIIVTLIQNGLLTEAQTFISKSSDEIKNSTEVKSAEIQHLCLHSETTTILQRGSELLRSGTVDPILYETMIRKSIEMRRSVAIIDDLLVKAVSAYPEKKIFFEGLIPKDYNPSKSG